MRIPHEARMQKAFFKWLFYTHREVRRVSFAIPNGGGRDIREAVSMKHAGLTPGVPDIMIAVPRGTFAGLFIEFKILPNRPTILQFEMMDNLSQQGYKCVVCYTLDTAITYTEEYLKGV